MHKHTWLRRAGDCRGVKSDRKHTLRKLLYPDYRAFFPHQQTVRQLTTSICVFIKSPAASQPLISYLAIIHAFNRLGKRAADRLYSARLYSRAICGKLTALRRRTKTFLNIAGAHR
jgi:hypothetical protein